MKHLIPYRLFESEEIIKPRLYYSILSAIGYYDAEYRTTNKYKYNKYNRDVLISIAENIYNKCKDIFPNSKIDNSNYSHDTKYNDNSNQLVYHSTYSDFDTFKTPAFFGAADGYTTDETITYACILNMTKPLELRRTILGEEKWIALLKDIFKDDKDIDNRIDFAEKYSDAYGFFKLLYNTDDQYGVYRWDFIYDYINANGYDGAIYRESDSSIQYYFDGFLVMKPEQIKILFKWDDDKNDFK